MSATILLIDDHAMFREGLFLALREAEPSMTVATARNGAEALDALATLPRLDAVMTDYYLPDLGGAALLGELHRRRSGLRILVLSASEDPQDIDTALDAGAQGFVHKSADSRQLMDALRRVMAGEHNVVQALPAGAAGLPVLSLPTDVLSRSRRGRPRCCSCCAKDCATPRSRCAWRPARRRSRRTSPRSSVRSA